MNKGIYLKTADIYLRFPEIMEEECNDLAEFLEDEHIVYEGATDIVYNLQQENQRLKEIEKEHQRINGRLHLEIRRLKEKYMKLEDKYIHNVSCCNEEDCDLFCEHQELKKQLEENQNPLKGIFAQVNDDTLLRDCGNMNAKINELKNQQKEFIKYMNDISEDLETEDVDDEEMKGYLIQRIDTFKEILQKYRSIIGDKE